MTKDSATGSAGRSVVTDVRFAPIPEDLLYDTELDPLAVRVYGCLMRHGLTASNCYPSHARIAGLIGISKRSVARPLKDLEDRGWIARRARFDDRGDRLSDQYEVRSERAAARTPHAEERGAPPSANGDPPTLVSAMKESHSEREPLNETSSSGSHTRGARDVAEEETADSEPPASWLHLIRSAAALHAQKACDAQPPGAVHDAAAWKAKATERWVDEWTTRSLQVLATSDTFMEPSDLLARIERGTSLPGYKLQPPAEHPAAEVIEQERPESAAVISGMRERIPTARQTVKPLARDEATG